MNEFRFRAEITAPAASAAVKRTTPQVACKDPSSGEDHDDNDSRAVQQQQRTTTAQEDGNSDNDNQGNHTSSRLDDDIWMDDDSSSLPPPPPSTTTTTTPSTTTTRTTRRSSAVILRNFVLQSVLVATVPATALACLALATAQLGNVLGARQSGLLYVSYTMSSLAGIATYVVKKLGARNALTVGMALFALYVACFVVALVVQDDDGGDDDDGDDDAAMRKKDAWALTGAAVGGMGAGILWTAQGVYLAHAARDYAMALQQEQQQQGESSRQHPRGVPVSTTTTSQGHNHAYTQATTFFQEEKAQDERQQVVSPWPIQNEPNTETMDQSTNYLAGLFAFCFLSLETTLDVLSTVLVKMGFPWRFVFAIYATATAVATGSVPLLVHNYPSDATKDNPNDDGPCHKAMAALRILRDDARIKYMWGMNAAFGLAGAFLTSFVNGQVVPVVLNRDDVGVLVALHGATAALCSLAFAQFASNRRRCRIGKHVILVAGALGYMAVALPFCIQPNLSAWTWLGIAGVYMAQGLGRATFEGTFRALFCDYFAYETEGAFANIILQNGLASAVGFVLSIRLPCTASTPSQHCIEYQDGSHHDILKFGMIVVGTSVLAIIGLFRASCLTESGTARSVPRPRARHYHAVVAQQSTVSDNADGEFSTTGISLSPLT